MVAACAGNSRSEVRAGWPMSVGAQDPVYRALQPCDRVRLQVRRRTCAQRLCCSACALTGARGAGCAGATRPVVSHLVRGGLLQQGNVGNRLHRVNRCVRARRACGFHHVSHRAIPQLRRSGATRRGRSRRRPELSLAHQGLLGVDLCVAGAERSVAYILTLGTDEAHRRRGLASALLARTLSECQARWLCLPGLHQLTPHAQADHRCLLLYLHVITYNDAALAFYARHGFQMLRRENQFYVIRQEHYDAFALGVYLNGGSAPSTASTAVSALHAAAAAALRWFVNNCTAARRPVCALPARGNDKSDA